MKYIFEDMSLMNCAMCQKSHTISDKLRLVL